MRSAFASLPYRLRLPLLASRTVVVAFAVMTLAPVRADDGDRNARKFATQLGNIETQVDQLVRQYANPTALIRKFPNQKRLIDARVFYELKQYENAAMLLFDLLERPDFRDDLEYEATQLLLGDCLLEMDNPQAARELFLRVASGRDPANAEEARLFLLELALGNPASTEEILRRAVNDLGGDATSDRTRYGLGKAELRLGNADKSIDWLQTIGTGSALYNRSRFYLGAAYVAKGQVDLALEIFRQLTTVEVKDKITTELRDQAWLAVGRLLVQRGNYDLGLTSYQNIDRNSPHYEEAVYEMSWAYINQDQFDKALQTVEVLLLTVKNDQQEIDAHVLRGQLNVMQQNYDEALASYQTIVDRFAPVRNELANFTKNPQDVQRYFKWLLERRKGLGQLKSPLSGKTVSWLESNSDFSRVTAVFDRIAGEREDIEKAREAGDELGKMLGAKNRVEMFPELRQGWTQALVLENQLVLVATRMLDRQNEQIRDRLDGKAKGELSEIVAWRRKLEEQASRLPTTFAAYEARQDEVTRQYRELERKNFFVEESIDEVQRQLIGVERFLNNKQYADSGKKLTASQEGSLRVDIESEKAELQAMYEELIALKKEIQLETMSVGTGDAATQGEDNLKASLLAALEREGAFYDQAGTRVGGSYDRDFKTYAGLRERLLGTISRLDQVIAAIDREVGEKTSDLIALVRTEVENLEGYKGEVSALDDEGRTIARQMGEDFFGRALARMDQVVLEADVGVLDVMWARKTEKTVELQALNEERGRRLKQLQSDLESIKTGAADEAAERTEAPSDSEAPPTPAPETPAPEDAAPPDGGAP